MRRVLVEVAHVSAKTKNTYLSAQYRRIASKRGKKRALIAVGHSVLVMIYHMLRRRQPYHELGGDYFDRRDGERAGQRLVKRLEQLGYAVNLAPKTAPGSA